MAVEVSIFMSEWPSHLCTTFREKPLDNSRLAQLQKQMQGRAE